LIKGTCTLRCCKKEAKQEPGHRCKGKLYEKVKRDYSMLCERLKGNSMWRMQLEDGVGRMIP
jgi:hypothetical protein